jgi:hypothetical protein
MRPSVLTQTEHAEASNEPKHVSGVANPDECVERAGEVGHVPNLLFRVKRITQ